MDESMHSSTSLTGVGGVGGVKGATSPQNQKRSRDYGHELKGLTPSDDDEDGQDSGSPHIGKRQKTTHDEPATHDVGGDGGDGKSGGLDDGEIVDVEQPVLVDASEYYPRRDLSPGKPSHEPQRQSDHTMVPEAHGHVHGTVAMDLSKEQKEAVDTSASQQESPGGARASDGPSQPRHAGWNHGVNLGMRTSFGSEPGREQEASGENQSEPPPPVQERKKKKKAKEKPAVPERPSTFNTAGEEWNFPMEALPEVDVAKEDVESPSYWFPIIDQWIWALVGANMSKAERLTPKAARYGFQEIYLVKRTGYLKGTKKQLQIAKTAAQKAMTSLSHTRLSQLLSEARLRRIEAPRHTAGKETGVTEGTREADEPVKAGEPDEAQQSDRAEEPNGARQSKQAEEPGEAEEAEEGEEIESPDDLTPEESRQKHRYFPKENGSARRCLSCSGTGHRAQDCPEQTCRFCHDDAHVAVACPTRQRCTKCRQFGHGVEVCEEMLALAPDEQGGCAFCDAAHADEDCTQIWRSYKPVEASKRKVRGIPAYCFNCGYADHYGPECKIPGRGRDVNDLTTWSQANRDSYVDAGSSEIAVAWVDMSKAPMAKGGGGPGFNIRGRAQGRRHTYFVSDDESEDEGLIRPSVKKPRGRNEIRISSNIGNPSLAPPMANGGGGGRNGQQGRNQSRANGGSNWQPPLPPGPPPPMHSNGYGGSLPPRPPANLPPRPQPFGGGGGGGGGGGRDYPPPSRNGRGGRGGYRGRGRGRGRGR
ncbi:hypothetical protein F4780DRAFT_575352 [Xylariomycetidae sp. FL0641]|nr:hypothetical protein F4780DRAFT_575352 [Xylariomycetidae sp. FL0641]